MRKNRYIAIVLLAAGLFTGCEDFLTVESPDQLTSDSFWRDKEDAEKALAAAYSKLEASTDTWEFAEVKWPVEAYREDIVNLGTDALNYPNWVELANFSYTNGNSQFTAYWRDSYRGINYTNQVIEGVPAIPEGKISEEDRTVILNEAHFLRGYYHLKLLLNWNEIVVRDEYITSAAQLDKALSGRPETWDFIIGEFEKATSLPLKRESDEFGRATQGAAYAFLGWAHLTRAYEEPDKKTAELEAAVSALEKVTGYELEEDFLSMFDATNKHSKEAIFELQFTLSTANGAHYRTQLHRWIGTSELRGWDEILPSAMLMNEFMKEGPVATTGRYDSRLYETVFFQCDYFNDAGAGRVYGKTYDEWFNREENGKTVAYNKPSFRKYMPADPAGLQASYFAPNIPLMRYANVLLMKAEALNELGKAAEAITLINAVRKRADMPEMKGKTQDEVRAQIEHERIIEFPLENLRFYDLRRWGKAKAALDAVGRTGFDPAKHNFYPVPVQELNSNNLVN